MLRVITRLNIGGPSIQAIDLTRELAQCGFETCLIHGSVSRGEGDMTSLRPAGELRTVFLEDLVRPVSPLRDARVFWGIFKVLSDWRPDIVHTHTAKAGAIGRAAALLYNATYGRGRKVRLVHTYHGHVFEGYFGSVSTQFFVRIERWLARRTDVIIAISAHVRSAIVKTYAIAREDQVRLVPLGFDLERLLAITDGDRSRAKTALGIPSDCITVTTVGRLTRIKQQALFLGMAAQLIRGGRSYRFLVVGDGELRSALEAETARLHLEPYVSFMGWRGDLDTIYAASDLFVLTSQSEGTPVALIEAMAAGVPSVSTDVGGVSDVITDDRLGALVPFGDVNQLTAAVERLVDEPNRRREMARAARTAAGAKFNRRRLVADVARLYQDLLKGQADAGAVM